jgi:hypothetical protein
VGAIVSKGTVEREYRLSVPNIETMVTDTAFILGSLRNRPFADRRQAGIIGMSNGAFAAVLMHLRNPEISAIVSLDGTIGEQAAARVLPKDPYFDASNVRAALLHLYATENPYLTLDTISSFINAERMLAAMPKMRHSDFLSYGIYERSVPGISGVPRIDNSAGFDWVCRLTLHFLRAQLLQDQESRKFLKNAVNQNPATDWISSITLQLP